MGIPCPTIPYYCASSAGISGSRHQIRSGRQKESRQPAALDIEVGGVTFVVTVQQPGRHGQIQPGTLTFARQSQIHPACIEKIAGVFIVLTGLSGLV